MFLCVQDSPDCPGTCCVDQAGLKLRSAGPCLLPKCWDEKRAPPPPGLRYVLVKISFYFVGVLPAPVRTAST